MMWSVLCMIFLLLWHLGDKYLKDRFTPILKYSSLILIAIIISVDIFMFIEKENLVFGHKCCDGCEDNREQNATCAECCLTYAQSPNIGYVENYTVLQGTELHGNLSSFSERDDGDYQEIMLDLQPPAVSEAFNFSNVELGEYRVLSLCVRTDNDIAVPIYVAVYNGSDWIPIYSFSNSSNYYCQDIDITNYQYIINDSIYFAIYTDQPGSAEQSLFVDEFRLEGVKSLYMYCSSSPDTGAIFVWHYVDYAVVPVITSTIPFLGIMVVFALAIQLLVSMYESASGGNVWKFKDRNLRGKDDDKIEV